MTRREWRRWAWAAAAGVAVASGAAAEDWGAKVRGPGDLPKAGDTVTMQFPGEAEKKYTVVKATRKPDGSVEVEYKDPTNGKTITTVDGPAANAPAGKPDPAPAAKPTPAGKDAGLPKAKPRAEDPIVSTPAPQADPPPPEPPAKKPRLLGRLFGKKSSPAPAAPASAPAEPPAVAPKVAVPGKPAAAAVEPPAAMPAKPTKPTPLVNVSVPAPLPPTPAAKPAAPARVEPVLPPTPGIPVPAPLPPAKPPAAETAPAIPVPSAPAVPVPLPSIPSAPGGGQSLKGRPAGGVVPAGYTPADAARMEEIQPHAVALKTAVAPSVRLLAAKALAGCRHASSDAVKGLLLDAAKGDPCPAVRADCIGYLCDLGCFTPAFAEVVKAACDDPSDEVKAAAKSATARMTRK